ncbi:TrkH family potassium uptake protein [Sunxiuqinia indica]|uniref:TrkH family potassium uptake protein n=1 Tax=Sunxiuqinia indica TaxID=2692584 RepID=UPI0013590E40|nr:TrkH family potassium uptake protein [Sunxiuqinia indica]
MNFQKRSNINILLVIHIISIILLFEGLFMILSLLISWYDHEPELMRVLYAVLTTFGAGGLLYFVSWNSRFGEPGVREGLVIVTFGWIFLAFFGSLPYLYTHTIPSFADAWFESMSGFTTTGSSILNDIEALPRSMLFWRSETHWIGGMGIIVLVVAIMPLLKMYGGQLFNLEASVVVEEKFSTKIRYVARSIWMIYVGLTALETVLLTLGGMNLFDSICHSFATVATGGFSTKNTSISDYSPYIQYVIAVFMLLSGINFVLHVLIASGKYKKALQNNELWFYLKMVFAVGAVLTLILFFSNEIPFEKAFRDSYFQVISVITATGFATDDYLLWPTQGILMIVLLMLVGACAGSTGGGVKVIRHYINWQVIKKSIKQTISPNAVCHVKYNNRTLSPKQVGAVSNFILLYYGIVVVGTITMIGIGNDWGTSFGSIVTTMGGIGPGFGKVGPASNFSMLTDPSKYLLTFTMLIGRLEIFPVLTLFTHWFWRT